MRPETVETKIAYATPETSRFSGTTVDCTGCLQGQVLTKDSLQDVPVSTTALHLRNNGFRDLPLGIFDHLTNLRKLDLGFNELLTLEAGVFDRLTELEDLDLGCNKLLYLPRGIFDSLGNLVHLSLYGNKLNEDTRFGTTSFPPPDHSTSIFDKLTKLRVLALGRNPLQGLAPGLLRNLKSLEVLNVMEGQLQSLEPDAFQDLPNLKGLVLAECDFRVPFHRDLFAGCQHLEALYFVHVWFHSLPMDVFRDCTHPAFDGPAALEGATFAALGRAMNLEFEGAEGPMDVPDAVEAGPPWLVPLVPTAATLDEVRDLPADTQELSLRGMGLRELPPGLLDRFTNLRTLDLGFNDLTELAPGSFDALTKLETLAITHTRLSTVPDGAFDQLANLRSLHLNDNRLARFPAGVFDGLERLESLTLDVNPLSLASFQSPETVFDKLTALKYLALSFVYFPHIPPGWFDNLRSLEAWWFYKTHNEELPAGLLDNLPELRIVDFASNPLTSLPAGFFDNNPKLEYLWLLENQFQSRADIADALTDEVKSRLKCYSTWLNPGWQTPPLFSDSEFRFVDPFKAKVEE